MRKLQHVLIPAVVCLALLSIVPAIVLRAAGQPPQPPPPPRTDLVAIDMGGRVERFPSEYGITYWSATNLLGTLPTRAGAWASKDGSFPKEFPQDLVFSFFGRQPALVASVVIDLATRNGKEYWAKDVEVWTSMESADAGFTKVAEKSLEAVPGDQAIGFTPVQAKYVKLRLLSNNGSKDEVQIGRVKVMEGSAPGYKPMIERYPVLGALMKGNVEAAFKVEPGPGVGAAKIPPGGPTCDATVLPQATNPKYSQSTNVLVLGDHSLYPGTKYTSPKPTLNLPATDKAVYEHVTFTPIGAVENLRPALLLPENGYDTVVLTQLCETKTKLTPEFKKALALWVGGGHKLIIQDSDKCNQQPDYTFLPYTIVTSNPGGRAAAGRHLIAVEENSLANLREKDPAFLDIQAWLTGRNNVNELGDSNTMKQWDQNWCGSLFGTNALHVNGFIEAYAHYGRGLIIYDGFDLDQAPGLSYARVFTRQLAQPFDPDGLPCTAHIGDFVITTEHKLKVQPMAPGRTYTYPLTLLSNQGYKGQVKLTATPAPADPGFSMKFDPPAVDLTEISTGTFTLSTTASSAKGPHMVTVRGVDGAGKSNVLCLGLVERSTGGLRIDSSVLTTKKRSKNLEIILDESGSMKMKLGTSTRIATARTVLQQVLAQLPDDFNVGLRVYGNRYPSSDKRTCTDTELAAPIARLNRQKITGIVTATQPRGETPLVHSVMQAANDLKAAGGGSIVLITDGEESCGGDPVQAGETLKASGIDATLEIVGFTLTGKVVQDQLAKFAGATGGHYYTAQNRDALAGALALATLDKLPFTAFDAGGKEVAQGTVGEGAIELPPGDYKIVVNAGTLKATLAGVKVTSGKDTTLTLSLKGSTLALTPSGGA